MYIEKGMATHSIFLPGEFLAGYSPWVVKEEDMNERLSMHAHYI